MNIGYLDEYEIISYEIWDNEDETSAVKYFSLAEWSGAYQRSLRFNRGFLVVRLITAGKETDIFEWFDDTTKEITGKRFANNYKRDCLLYDELNVEWRALGCFPSPFNAPTHEVAIFLDCIYKS